MGSVFTCKLNPCCGDRHNCNPPRQYDEPDEVTPSAEADASQRTAEETRKALEPFATYAETLDGCYPTRHGGEFEIAPAISDPFDTKKRVTITLAQARRARALAGDEPDCWSDDEDFGDDDDDYGIHDPDMDCACQRHSAFECVQITGDAA